MTDLLSLSLKDAVAALREGRVSSETLTRAALERAEAVARQLNAFVRIDADRALEQARACDAARAAGEAPGPLHGIPLAHKDMFYREGEVSTCGSQLREHWRAPVTATVLQRLDAAGAIQIGNLHMTEFAYGPTGQNGWLGDGRNPWASDHISGGSSSGPGIAVATRSVFGALGSDTAGSIRMPSNLCGVTGMKPTSGLVPVAGSMPLSATMDTVGPLTRSVEDNALLLDILVPQAAQSYAEAAEAGTAGALPALRVGVPKGYFDRDVHPDIAALLAAAAQQMADIGLTVAAVEMPDMDVINAVGMVLTWGDVLSLHGRQMKEQANDYSAQTRGRLQSTLAVSTRDYLDARRARPALLRQFCDQVFSRCDVVLAPMLAIPTPKLSEVDVNGGSAMMRILNEVTRLGRPVNTLGVPALALPCGFCDGMPAGMQLIGRPYAESLLYRIGAAYQAATDWHLRAPPGCGQ